MCFENYVSPCVLCCLLVTSAVGLEGLLPLLTLLEGLLDDTFEDPEAADTDLAPPPSVGLSGVLRPGGFF